MSSDASYFATRADQERRLAMASADPRVRRVHLEMAAQYAACAGADAVLEKESPDEIRRRIA